ncbi:shikimate kinase [Wenyingzhuangia sp. 2_MG-2023]|uniref:shikimate kinase n=1 Tax=Wenyingzhuangia sp. 2_MG-2023 TaxID=3062639 RepID=UPI0026E39ED6|nr:shikimate kinase [Wenyingzhuangia sp. 2_MG-2023]MDO6737762.1 shikimate kinase [Wenyingzhuangia sp. 2_MG-2023]
MKLVLVGYMGCGKSAISKALSNRLEVSRIDLDDYIEMKEGKLISQIFSDQGEIYFRKREMEYLNEILTKKEDFILSLGGGTPCFGNNMNLVNANATSVYLNANIPTLVERLLPEKSKRPLIARIEDADLPEFIGKHLFERNQFYLQAQLSVAVNAKSVDEIVSEILSKI